MITTLSMAVIGSFSFWVGYLMAKPANPRRGTLERQPAASRMGRWCISDTRGIHRL